MRRRHTRAAAAAARAAPVDVNMPTLCEEGAVDMVPGRLGDADGDMRNELVCCVRLVLQSFRACVSVFV